VVLPAYSEEEVLEEITEGRKIIAVIPVQKIVQKPLYLSTEPDALTSLKLMFQDQKLSLGKHVDYDPEMVQRTLNRVLTDSLIRKGYLVYKPEDVGPYFNELTVLEEEGFSAKQLNIHFKDVNAYLYVTLTKWDAEKFDSNGKVEVSFQSLLIHASSNQIIWSAELENKTFGVPSKGLKYRKYEPDVLNAIAAKMLRGFPRPDVLDESV